jgi:hypothetical protein
MSTTPFFRSSAEDLPVEMHYPLASENPVHIYKVAPPQKHSQLTKNLDDQTAGSVSKFHLTTPMRVHTKRHFRSP